MSTHHAPPSTHDLDVIACFPFTSTPTIEHLRAETRAARERGDLADADVLRAIVEHVHEAVLSLHPGHDLRSVTAWIGMADRLAMVHSAGLLELVAESATDRERPDDEPASGLEFITVVGPRPGSLRKRAAAYATAARALLERGGDPIASFTTARDLCVHAMERFARLPKGEREWRLLVAIGGWTFFDDEPAARPYAASCSASSPASSSGVSESTNPLSSCWVVGSG